MVDIAKLSFDVDSKSIKTANDNLEKMDVKSRKAAKGQSKFERAARGGADAANKLERAARGGAVASNKLTRAAKGTSAQLGFMKTALVTLAALVLTAFSITPIFAFKDAIAEVSTLVNTATFDMRKINEESLNMARLYGGTGASQAKAFYQIISASALTALGATNTLNIANKLAVGGKATIPFYPALRKSPLNNITVNISSPKVKLRFQSPSFSMNLNTILDGSATINAIEAMY